jgi:hypothetical protein
VFASNVRGSSGFGKRFVNLDNGALRESSVKDIKAAVDAVVAADEGQGWRKLGNRANSTVAIVGGSRSTSRPSNHGRSQRVPSRPVSWTGSGEQRPGVPNERVSPPARSGAPAR